MDKVQVYVDKVKAYVDKNEYIEMAHKQTGLEKLHIAAGISVVALLFITVGFGAGFFCNLVGFLYPAYCSFKAIESEGKADDTQWLTYWVVYACFTIIEVFIDFLLTWIPFYYAFKLGFLLWLFMPQTMGAKFLYANFLAPFLKSNETRIDSAMKSAMSSSGSVLSDVTSVASEIGSDIGRMAATKAVQNQFESDKEK